MEQNQQQPRTINLDGESYDLDQFTPGVQQAVAIYNKFSAQLQDQQLEVMKIQAALQQVGQQITETVKKELAEKAEDKSPAANNGAAGEPEMSDFPPMPTQPSMTKPHK